MLPALALAGAPCARAAALEVYRRLPRYENVVLSPDGARVAFVRTDENARAVVVQELASGKRLGQLRAGDQKLRGIRWADNDRLMIFTSVTAIPFTFLWNESEWRQLQIFDLKSGRNYMVPQPNGDISLMTMITGNATVRRIKDHTVLFVGGLQVTGRPILHGRGREVVPVLVRVDLESDSSRIVFPGRRGFVDSWTIDDVGEVVAEDGLQIPAYLTLPRGKPAQKLPLIVLPHSNPAGRDTADFNWWSQALADQGYAVLRPNYRGSELNRAFLARGFGEWGRKMQTDLSDGVRYLAHEGVIDPARVCIVGASYGGYAALAGVSLDPGVYRCAVSVAGISDLHGWLHWVNHQHYGLDTAAQRYWERFIGASGPNDASADAISPLGHLDAITVPVLLIHGKDDTVMPFEQSQVIYEALRKANKDVELVALKGEDHWLSRSETRLQMLEASVAFLRAHDPPD
jgi:dipeptidyl aminopeptidase/acylaminoacyl peptidase